MIRIYSYGLIALMLVTSACNQGNKEAPMTQSEGMVISNGFVIDDDDKPAKPFVVGVGDSVSHLVKRNPFLSVLNLPHDSPLRLPLLQKLDVTYDDGDLRLKIGCSFTSNLDGNSRYQGVASAGFKLCDPAINDWALATKRAAEFIKRFELENPDAKNLESFMAAANDEDRQKIGGGLLLRSERLDDQLRTEEEANKYFAELAAQGHREQLEWRQGSYSPMGRYLGKKAIFMIGVSKNTYFGGGDLTEEERRTMKYEVTMGFYLRQDVMP